ncbi:uncharacterized protein LOC144913689 [Branchiostoma floridae x Branchiostoma belcheri]
MAFLLLTFCCALLCNVNLTSGFPTSSPACPEGQVWDSHLKACQSCTICEVYPETPLCTSCKSTSNLNSGPQKVSVVPTVGNELKTCEKGYAWDAVQNRCVWCGVCDTHPDTPFCGQCRSGTPSQPASCPEGAVWDGFLRRCVDCAVCGTHPDTPVCRACPRTEAPDGLKSDAPPVLAAVLTSVAVCLTAGLMGVAVWVKYGPDWGVCRCCGHGQKGRQFPEVEPGQTARGYKVTQVADDSGCSSMGSSYASITLLTTDIVTVV